MSSRVRTAVAFAILAAQLLLLVLVVPARGASLLWSLTASPLSATTGVQKTFTLTATNEDPLAALSTNSEIGCVVVDVPSNFTVAAAVVTGSNAGNGWHVDSIVGNRVTVHSESGGDRLELLGWVRFTITATPFKAGSLAWNARAFRDGSCAGTAALLGIPPVVVVTGPAITPTPVPTLTPTPTPKPTPKPTPTATPTPTPRPTPTPTPLPLPSAPLPSVPLPSASLPLPLPSSGGVDTPEPTPRPPSADPRPTPTTDDDETAAIPGGGPVNPGSGSRPGPTVPGIPGTAPAGAGGAVPPPLAPTAPRIAFDEASLAVETLAVDLISGIEVWTVPAAALGVPGILLIVWVALQAVGALAWIPAVKRLSGEEPAVS